MASDAQFVFDTVLLVANGPDFPSQAVVDQVDAAVLRVPYIDLVTLRQIFDTTKGALGTGGATLRYVLLQRIFWAASAVLWPVSPEPVAPLPVEPPTTPPEGGTIIDTIIGWIKFEISKITNLILVPLIAARDWLFGEIGKLLASGWNMVSGWIEGVKRLAQGAWDWAVNTYNLVSGKIIAAWTDVTSAVSSALAPVWGWIDGANASINNWISYQVGNLQAWIGTTLAGISAWIAALPAQIGSYFEWLNTALPHIVGDVLSSWWDGFLAHVFELASWVGKLFDSMTAWFNVDVPGHSPRWRAGLDSLWEWLSTSNFNTLARLFSNPVATISHGMLQIVQPTSEYLLSFFTSFVDRMAAETGSIGAITPGDALSVNKRLNGVMTTVITGLVGMTIAGNMTVLGSKIGLGNVSAMIYDLTNYKVLTGAFVGALAFAAIQTPLRYYYNSVFRPRLPSEGDAARMLSEDKITSAQFRELLGYAGYADQYHGDYEDMAYRPMSLVALSSLATAGGFDEATYTEVLRDRGIKPKWRPYMLDLYRRKGGETIKGIMSSVPITRYKNGYTDIGGFGSEMALLGYTSLEIDHYAAAAGLSYATDYINDLISAWQSQVRKKIMSLDDYRANLATVIPVQDRVDALVIKELVNAPVEEPKAAGISIAVTRYSTGETTGAQFRDELALLGSPAIDVDRNVAAANLVYAHDYIMDLKTAYTDAIRAGNLTLDEFRQALLGIGLVPERVEGLVLIERARLKPKQALKPTSPPSAFYATDVGKIQVDTIRRRRRKGTITRDEEIAALIGTGYEPAESTVIADNDDERLNKGVTPPEETVTAG